MMAEKRSRSAAAASRSARTSSSTMRAPPRASPAARSVPAPGAKTLGGWCGSRSVLTPSLHPAPRRFREQRPGREPRGAPGQARAPKKPPQPPQPAGGRRQAPGSAPPGAGVQRLVAGDAAPKRPRLVTGRTHPSRSRHPAAEPPRISPSRHPGERRDRHRREHPAAHPAPRGRPQRAPGLHPEEGCGSRKESPPSNPWRKTSTDGATLTPPAPAAAAGGGPPRRPGRAGGALGRARLMPPRPARVFESSSYCGMRSDRAGASFTRVRCRAARSFFPRPSPISSASRRCSGGAHLRQVHPCRRTLS